MSYVFEKPREIAPSSPGLKRLQYKVYTDRHLDQIRQLQKLDQDTLHNIRVISRVLPFRVNNYVIEQLIDWNNIPGDPMFQLTFPQKGMLEEEDFERMSALIRANADKAQVSALARELREKLNPHPAGQQELNVPRLDGQPLDGMQHKYRETVLFFPSQGQTCHSYCTFCFRWAQFVGDKELKFATRESDRLQEYLSRNRQVSDLLITGGDPMVMKTSHLENYLLPLLDKKFDHIQSIRIGSKALSFWPYRFVTDEDAEDLLRLLERMIQGGKNIAFMAHFNHWRELDTPIVREAIQRIRATGAVIRSQSPLIARINDDADVWARMWEEQVKLGIVPYYMFVERDTGAKRYFEVPLARACDIYRDAIQQVSGLARTARGPSMSAGPGKVEIQGIAKVQGEKVFVLRFIQGRDASWVQQPFFAQFDAQATWLDDLKPAFGEKEFPSEASYKEMCHQALMDSMIY